MRNIIHIHTDSKFLYSTTIFEGELFKNEMIFITSGKACTKTYPDTVKRYGTSAKDIKTIIHKCNGADLVVLYGLDYIKSHIALAISKEIKIAWRFFGYELYSKRADLFIGGSAQKLLKKKETKSTRIKQVLLPVYEIYRFGLYNKDPFSKAIERIDIFLALSNEEYEFLCGLFPRLPQFVKLPHVFLNNRTNVPDSNHKRTVKPRILIGNNRSAYNNHLDIIQMIDECETKNNYDFTFFLNYGKIDDYAREVIKQVEEKSCMTALTDFLSLEEFENIYNNAVALVINGYRQMAGGNIRTALRTGVKVYLNQKNVHKRFLENQGFKIFSIQDFKRDLKKDKLGFDKEVALFNRANFTRFAKAYTQMDFQKKLSSVLS